MPTAFEHYRAMPKAAEQNRRNFNEKLKMPVLALGGEQLMGDLPLNSLRLVAEDVRGGVILGSGHWVASERLDNLVQQLLTFFGEIAIPTSTPWPLNNFSAKELRKSEAYSTLPNITRAI